MISVIVSSYQQKTWLPWLLTALERQDYAEPFEVIVCDDGSTPAALPVVEEIARHDKLDLRYVWQPHRGFRVGRSRNNGTRCARGDILIFIDGDILVAPDFVSRHVQIHRENHPNPMIVAGTRRWVRLDLETDAARSYEEILERCQANHFEHDSDTQKLLARSRLPWLGCWGFNHSLPARPEIQFDEVFMGWGNEDIERGCRLVHGHGYRVSFRDDLGVFHLTAQGAADWNPWITFRHEHISQYIKSCFYFKEKYPNIDLSPVLIPLKRFIFDRESEKWRHAFAHERPTVEESLRIAQEWCREKAEESESRKSW